MPANKYNSATEFFFDCVTARGAFANNVGGNRAAAKDFGLEKRPIGGSGSPLGYAIVLLAVTRESKVFLDGGPL
mgnify:CR=1 FL=1